MKNWNRSEIFIRSLSFKEFGFVFLYMEKHLPNITKYPLQICLRNATKYLPTNVLWV